MRILEGDEAINLPEARIVDELIVIADDPAPCRLAISKKRELELRRARLVVDADQIIARANERLRALRKAGIIRTRDGR